MTLQSLERPLQAMTQSEGIDPAMRVVDGKCDAILRQM